MYSINKVGKITPIHEYTNNGQFEEIISSGTTQENGKFYINPLYISVIEFIEREMAVLAAGCYRITSQAIHLCSSPLFIPDGLFHLLLMACIYLKVFVSSLRSVPCPFNTAAFDYSSARQFATSACAAIAKAHSFSETLHLQYNT